ncbi:MAG: hypothetical protein AABY28_05355 [Candidatus Omnitrophota bacterium]
MDNQSVDKLFELSILAERIMQDYYSGLTEKFSHLPQIQAFWQSMADDEIEHIQELENTRKEIGFEKLFLPVGPELFEKIKCGLKFSVLDMLGKVKNLDEAYEFSHELEYSESNAIFKFLATKFISSLEREKFVSEIIARANSNLASALTVDTSANVTGLLYQYDTTNTGETDIASATITGSLIANQFDGNSISSMTITYNPSAIPDPPPEGFDGFTTKKADSWSGN